MKNVLFYAVNGIGLGHLTRLLAIARQMKAVNYDIQPIFLTSSEACNVLYKHNIAYYKLPSKNLARDTSLKKSSLSLMYQQMALSLITIHKPCAIVVDTFPIGSLDDLLGVLAGKNKMKKIFIHREQQPAKMTPAKIALQNFYNLIIAPHHEGKANIPVPTNRKLFWAGNIMVRNKDELLPKKRVFELFNLPQNKKIIYVNLGGGGDTTTVENKNLIIDILTERDDVHIVVTKAPLCKEVFSYKKNMTQIDWYPTIELMKGFDLAVSATGYNTFHELMYCGVPTLFIPKARGLDDQKQRALTAETNKAGFCLEEHDIENNLNTLVDELISNHSIYSNNAKMLVPHNGAILAAKKILQLMEI